MVISRLKSLQKKLKMNPTFHNDYKKLMLTLLQNGVEEVVPERELFRNDGKVYIPPKETYKNHNLSLTSYSRDQTSQTVWLMLS